MAEEEKARLHEEHRSGDMNADGIRDDAKVKHVEVEEDN
jgi:hypothetical protein